jgi:hypothetical protein
MSMAHTNHEVERGPQYGVLPASGPHLCVRLECMQVCMSACARADTDHDSCCMREEVKKQAFLAPGSTQ